MSDARFFTSPQEKWQETFQDKVSPIYGMTAFVCGSVIAVLQVIRLYRDTFFFQKGKASESWERTDGHIKSASLSYEYPILYDLATSRYFVPKVEYTFEVQGKSFTGNTIRFMEICYRTEEKAKIELDQYSIDTTIPIYYNPQDPSQNVIHKGQNIVYHVFVNEIGRLGVSIFG